MVRAEKEKIIVLLCERHETRKQEKLRVSRAVTAKKYTKTKSVLHVRSCCFASQSSWFLNVLVASPSLLLKLSITFRHSIENM